MPNKKEWSMHRPAIRRWLEEGYTGKQVAGKLAKIDFYVTKSQVNYRARRWGYRKRLPVHTATPDNGTGQNSAKIIFEQMYFSEHLVSSIGSKHAQLGGAWAVGESDTSDKGHVGFTILSSPSSSATQHWDHHVAGVTTHSSASRQHEGILDDVDTHWLVNQDEPSSPQSQGPQGRNDPGPSVDEDAERPFEPNGNPTGLFGFSHDNNGLTDLGIDLQSLPLSLPLWDPISLYGESEFAYNTDTESGQEDTIDSRCRISKQLTSDKSRRRESYS